jgi:hypothetical protein
MSGLRAIMVSVDYTDLLAVTLPYNRHHFDEVWIVTSCADYDNVLPVAEANEATLLGTDLFYTNGARFNKWAALEWGLDQMGREGWIGLIDADVAWPRSAVVETRDNHILWGNPSQPDRFICQTPGYLCSPLRRMCTDLDSVSSPCRNQSRGFILPPESMWGRFPIHRNVNEWAGYSQVFHASDPSLPKTPPWHETNWIHAGGADSFFQNRWPKEKKIRPPFEVLHLGPAGENWFGRSSRRLDGSQHPEAGRRRADYLAIWDRRRALKRSGADPFSPEKL